MGNVCLSNCGTQTRYLNLFDECHAAGDALALFGGENLRCDPMLTCVLGANTDSTFVGKCMPKKLMECVEEEFKEIGRNIGNHLLTNKEWGSVSQFCQASSQTGWNTALSSANRNYATCVANSGLNLNDEKVLKEVNIATPIISVGGATGGSAIVDGSTEFGLAIQLSTNVNAGVQTLSQRCYMTTCSGWATDFSAGVSLEIGVDFSRDWNGFQGQSKVTGLDFDIPFTDVGVGVSVTTSGAGGFGFSFGVGIGDPIPISYSKNTCQTYLSSGPPSGDGNSLIAGLDNGATCDSNSQCDSGYCVDGVCNGNV